MSAPDEVYVLLYHPNTMEASQARVAHTTLQGAAMEMVSYSQEDQKNMWVVPVRLVDDGES